MASSAGSSPAAVGLASSGGVVSSIVGVVEGVASITT